jgi:hypothetical protein
MTLVCNTFDSTIGCGHFRNSIKVSEDFCVNCMGRNLKPFETLVIHGPEGLLEKI